MKTRDFSKIYMIDFETLGMPPNALVIQIGACSFDLTKKFKANIDGKEATKNGAKIDYETVSWWMSQSDEARKSVTADPLELEQQAFSKLNKFLGGADEIWSHATFDFCILMETLKRLDIKPAFGYKIARDIRTLQALVTVPVTEIPDRIGVHHDALDDAIYQVSYCKPYLK